MMIGNRIKELRDNKKLNLTEFAIKICTSAGYLSDVEKNKKKPGSDFLQSLKTHFNVSVDWLLTGDGSMFLEETASTCLISAKDTVNVPIYYDIEASAGNGSYVDIENPDDYICFSKKYLKEYIRSCEKLSVIQVRGDSMAPTILNKNWLLIDHSQNEPKQPGIYVIRIADELYVKRIQKSPAEKIIRVKSDNPIWKVFDIPYDKFTDFQIIGKVALKLDNRFE